MNLKSEFLDLLVLCFLPHKMFQLNSKYEFLKSYLTKVIKGEKTRNNLAEFWQMGGWGDGCLPQSGLARV